MTHHSRIRSAFRLLAGLHLVFWIGIDETHALAPPAEHSIRRWTQRDGLPSNEINGLIQDRAGYLIIGTPGGMVRFDGKRFVPMIEATGASRRQRGFVAIVEHPIDDSLLVAPRSGGIVEVQGDASTEYSLPPSLGRLRVEALLHENAHTLWIGFRGGTVVRQSTSALQVFDSRSGLNPTGRVQFALDGAGRVWIAAGTFLARHEGDVLVPIPIGNGRERLRIASARKDGPWILADERLCKFEDGQIQQFDEVSGKMAAHYTQALLEDSTGNLWFGTRSIGLRRRSPEGSVQRFLGLPSDITAVVEDNLGHVWVGSNGGGLLRVKPGVARTYNRSVGLMEDQSLAVCQDESGQIWLANRDGGIAWLNRQGRATVIEKPSPWDKFSVVSVSPRPGGGIWASTTNGLLSVTKFGIRGAIEYPALSGVRAPTVMFTARNGDLWAALSPVGTVRVRGDIVTMPGESIGLQTASARTFSEDSGGRIWVGCEDGRLFRSEGETFTRTHDLASLDTGPIQAIHFDTAGTCWIGTERGGLLRLDANGPRAVTTQDGLVSNNITQILADREGALWLGSPGGIFHLPVDEIHRLLTGATRRIWPAVMGPDEGVAQATCLGAHQPAAWKSRDGVLWFATRQGVLAIDPRAQRDARTTLKTRIDAVWIDEQLHPPGGPLRFASSVRSLEIAYSSLCLATPDHVRVRYRLDGYDKTWIEADGGGVARYPGLSPGRYRFEVASFVAGRPPIESGDAIVLEVVAAWWQTPWFLLAASTAGLAGLILTVRRWSHSRLMKKVARLERESALEKERARIARDIHDDLGAGLTRISLLTQSARDQACSSRLDRIYHAVGELTQSMDEIVWAVNPKNDDLESLVGYIGEFAQGYLADAGLRCRFLFPQTLPGRPVSAQFRHHLFLACKEALNNLVKHAHATSVTLQFALEGDGLVVCIADDGIGMPPDSGHPPSHHGLANMQSRMEAIGGDLQILPATPTGTLVVLTASLANQPVPA